MSKPVHRVLVVDDDESIRESLCKLLQGEGFQVAAGANGLAAVKMLCHDRQPFDLLLVDLNMPVKNGWATLDRVLEINPFLPVIIVTGQPDQQEMAEAAGVNALVEKPVDVPLLLEIVHKLLAGAVESRLQRADQQFYRVCAAGYTRGYAWKNPDAAPYLHGGLNE
jgi:CheY-like chemotaxis protein